MTVANVAYKLRIFWVNHGYITPAQPQRSLAVAHDDRIIWGQGVERSGSERAQYE